MNAAIENKMLFWGIFNKLVELSQTYICDTIGNPIEIGIDVYKGYKIVADTLNGTIKIYNDLEKQVLEFSDEDELIYILKEMFVNLDILDTKIN